MTRLSWGFSYTMQKDAGSQVSAHVHFTTSRFPDYIIGADDEIVEYQEYSNSLPMKATVARETAMLLEQHNRISVCDLARNLRKARLKEVVSLEKHILIKKLKDALQALRGRVAGKNRDDLEDAMAMVEALTIQLTKSEEELLHENAEMKKVAAFLKQAYEDAKKHVNEERACARVEIENARGAVQRVEEAFQEQERTSGKQDMEELMREIQEARRIKMLHQPSKDSLSSGLRSDCRYTNYYFSDLYPIQA
ncbi:stomatal closure-related actin-binding protein 1-like isoform X2 [Andrographis paniculata]|uniref:stomatal closure-related actin-binding protein 1-like isoform X2 n=1 Tax=Andrographis paniculata TaxID=175694 RepID=UPI0021E9440A|nr:stomatal closure-related actin-binding protein 1-like isoform X2 [Andrographis paniculata]